MTYCPELSWSCDGGKLIIFCPSCTYIDELNSPEIARMTDQQIERFAHFVFDRDHHPRSYDLSDDRNA